MRFLDVVGEHRLCPPLKKPFVAMVSESMDVHKFNGARELEKKRPPTRKIQNTLLASLSKPEKAPKSAPLCERNCQERLCARQGALFPWRRASCGTGARFGRAWGAKQEKAGKAPRFKGQDGCVGRSVERLAKKTWRPSSRMGKRRWPLRECCIAAGINSLSRKPLGVRPSRLRFCRGSIKIALSISLSITGQQVFEKTRFWGLDKAERSGKLLLDGYEIQCIMDETGGSRLLLAGSDGIFGNDGGG